MTKKKKIENAFDCLAVTEVNIFPFKTNFNLENVKVKAIAEIVLNDQMILRGLRVIDGPNGLYVSYPVDPFFKGEGIHSIVLPITRLLREHIENSILEKYQEKIEEVLNGES